MTILENRKSSPFQNITIDDVMLEFTVRNVPFKFDLSKISSRLEHATPSQRERVELSPDGEGIHWPEVDEDLSLIALIRSKTGG